MSTDNKAHLNTSILKAAGSKKMSLSVVKDLQGKQPKARDNFLDTSVDAIISRHVMPTSSWPKKAEGDHKILEPRKKMKVLDEDDFSDHIAKIVERDFYPDLSKLKSKVNVLGHRLNSKRSKVDYNELHERLTTSCIRSTRRDEHANLNDTPRLIQAECNDEDSEKVTGAEQFSNPKKTVINLKNSSLNEFVSEYTGEDNASFAELQKADLKKHKEKYWWVYDKDRTIKHRGGKLMLEDGRSVGVNSKYVKENFYNQKPKLIANDGIGGWKNDDRKGVLKGWKYRIKNQLMFPPELSDSLDICRVNESKRKISGLIQDVNKAEKITNYSNTRFTVRTCTDTGVPTFISTAGSPDDAESDNGESMDNAYDYLSTPQFIPGENVTPLLTWGAIEGTPNIIGTLDKTEKLSDTNMTKTKGRHFGFQPISKREMLARKMERASSSRRRQSSIFRRNNNSKSTSVTPFTSPRHRRINNRPQSLNWVLSQKPKFSGDRRLRESYSNKRKKSARASSCGRMRSKVRRITSTPRLPNHDSKNIYRSRVTAASSGCDTNKIKMPDRVSNHSSLTDGLLEI